MVMLFIYFELQSNTFVNEEQILVNTGPVRELMVAGLISAFTQEL